MKISQVLRDMEVESSFLSGSGASESVPRLLENLFEQLNSRSEASVQLGKGQTRYLNLKLVPKPRYRGQCSSLSTQVTPLPPHSASDSTGSFSFATNMISSQRLVRDCDVPVDVSRDGALFSLLSSVPCELTLQRIIPFIDGVNHVYRISKLSGVDLEFAKSALISLAALDLIKFIDTFTFSNIYLPASGLASFYTATAPQKQLALSSVLSNHRSSRAPSPALSSTTPYSYSLSFPILFQMYSALDGTTTIGEFCRKQPIAKFKVDIRRFVSFGILNNLIQRLFAFIIAIPTTSKPHISPEHIELANIIFQASSPILYDLLAIHHGKLLCDELLAAYPTYFQLVYCPQMGQL